MVSFLMVLSRMLRGIGRGMKDPEFQVLLTLMVFTLFSGTIFYSTVEGLRVFDAFYFSVITLSTVGYGDFSPQTDFGKLFTVVYIFTGIGLLMAFAGRIFQYIELNRMELREKIRKKHQPKNK
ncbi:MAG: two pore domain potassium channel family protein [Alkalicoccus sp.]|nr:MAG: two pore domain potassium channel family protein [Alkalicoccus sp.]